MGSCALRRLSILTLFLPTVLGCGDDRPPVIDQSGSPTTPTTANGVKTELKTGACDAEGETATCVVDTGRTADIVNCFHGAQTCRDGTWSDCEASADAIPAQ